MTRLEALIALKEAVEAGRDPKLDEWREVFPDAAEDDDYPLAMKALQACSGWQNAACEWLHAVLPGWGWRMAQCSVSDDAWVFPDFNCPVHGQRLRETVPVMVGWHEWFELTDIDLRPPGNPARALMISGLTALIALERLKMEKSQ